MVKVVYVYNEHDSRQVELIERVKSELGIYLVEVLGSQEAKDRYYISQLPALIPVCEYLQGDYLLTEDGDGKLRMVAEVWKWMEEGEKRVHDQDTNRLDNLINREVKSKQDDLLEEMMERGVL